MNHEEIRHKLSEYIDGSLSPEEKTAVDEHLKTCPKCGEALAELKKTVEHIMHLEEIEPPAWMTQKIMARVRDEEQKKRSLFRRLFFPLHIKLPLEAVGVVLLAVTVYITSQEAKPVRLSETASQEWTTQDKAAPVPQRLPEKKAEQSIRQKSVPQEPEYKALDMKPAYEGASRPVPEQRTPAPASKSVEPAESEKLKSESYSGRAEDRAKSMAAERAPARKILSDSADMEKTIVTIVVPDAAESVQNVEESIKQVSGSILRREVLADISTLTARVSTEHQDQLMQKLKQFGKLQQTSAKSIEQDGQVIIEIRLVQPK